MMHYDDILKNIIGELGTHQKICFFLLGISTVPVMLIIMSPVFLFPPVDTWCKYPDSNELRQHMCITNSTGNCDELVKNLMIPKEKKVAGCETQLKYEQCHRYNISFDYVSYYPEANIYSYINQTGKIECDHGWKYDRSQYKSTVTGQFDLVCDRFYLNALASSIFMLGFLVGSLVSGYVLDRFGRMKGFMLTNGGVIIFGIIEAFSPNYVVFVVVRFFLAMCTIGRYISSFVLVCEYVGPTKRTICGMIYPMFLSTGIMILALEAYFIRHWWVLQLVIVVPCILSMSYWWITPESPRWLISKGRMQEAEMTIRKIAKINNVTEYRDLLSEAFQLDAKLNQDVSNKRDQLNYGAVDLLRYPNMRKKTVIMFYSWITATLVYYGISFDTSSLGGNPYVNTFISGAVEIPAYALGMVMMKTPRIGRRGSLFALFTFGGVACIGLAFVPACGDLVWLGITLAMLGKFGIASAFGMVYVYSAELFPTPLRSTGVGMCSLFARIGGILAPQLILMGTVWKPLPPIVFGVTSIFAGILILTLPETLGTKLPETLEEAEEFGKKQRHKVHLVSYDGYGEIRKINGNKEYDIASV